MKFEHRVIVTSLLLGVLMIIVEVLGFITEASIGYSPLLMVSLTIVSWVLSPKLSRMVKIEQVTSITTNSLFILIGGFSLIFLALFVTWYIS